MKIAPVDHRGNSFSIADSMRTTSTPQIPVMPPYVPDAHSRLQLNSERHLRLPPATVRKMDGNLGNFIPHQISHIRHLDQEHIPIRPNPVERDAFQCLTLPHAVTGCHIAQREVKNCPRIGIPKGRQGFSPKRPAPGEGTAFRIPGPNHHVAGFDTARHLNQNSGIVGKIRVHLDHDICPSLESLCEPLKICGPQSQFPGAMEDVNSSRMLHREIFSNLTGPIRAVIVHYEQGYIQWKRKKSGDQSGKVLRFVIGRQNNRDLHACLFNNSFLNFSTLE